jgi:colicin import membrane protein
MSELLNAVDQIKSWANKNRAIVVLADELERIGSLEQAADEAQRKMSAATKDLADVNAQIAAGRQAVKEATAQAEHIIQIAAGELQSARSDASAIRREASDKASVIVSNATAQASTIREHSEAEAKSAQNDVRASKAEAARWQQEAAAAQKAVEDYKQQLADAKERAKAAFRGIE